MFICGSQMTNRENQFLPSIKPRSSGMVQAPLPTESFVTSRGHTVTQLQRSLEGFEVSVVHLSRSCWWSPLPCPAPSVGLSGLPGPGTGNWSREGFGSDELGTSSVLQWGQGYGWLSQQPLSPLRLLSHFMSSFPASLEVM